MNPRLPSQTRKARIREMLQQHDAVGIQELAVSFGVSEMTIRRDLDELERGGQVRRTHGGAVPAERMSFEFNFHQRREAARRQKQAIAREAARLVQPGQTLIIDNGTTTLELAMELRECAELTIITPSLAVASALQFSESLHVILLGGTLRRGRPDLTGGVTEQMLEMFTADLVFQGADGIDREGWIYNEDVQLARVDLKMRERASQSWLLADGRKIGRGSLMRGGHVREVTGLITDSGADPECLAGYRELGIDLRVVEA